MSKRTPENCGIIKNGENQGETVTVFVWVFQEVKLMMSLVNPVKSVNIAQAMKRLKFSGGKKGGLWL